MTYSPIYIHMPEWIELIEKQGTFKVNTIMEIGSMDGADAAYLAEHFKPDIPAPNAQKISAADS